MSSDEQKTAATPGPAAVKREGGKKGGAAGGQREPQYNDTPEHEEQTKRIKEVERQIKEVQGKLVTSCPFVLFVLASFVTNLVRIARAGCTPRARRSSARSTSRSRIRARLRSAWS